MHKMHPTGWPANLESQELFRTWKSQGIMVIENSEICTKHHISAAKDEMSGENNIYFIYMENSTCYSDFED